MCGLYAKATWNGPPHPLAAEWLAAIGLLRARSAAQGVRHSEGAAAPFQGRPRYDAATLADTVFCRRPLLLVVMCLAVSSTMPRKAAQRHGRRAAIKGQVGVRRIEQGWAQGHTGSPTCRGGGDGTWSPAAAGNPVGLLTRARLGQQGRRAVVLLHRAIVQHCTRAQWQQHALGWCRSERPICEAPARGWNAQRHRMQPRQSLPRMRSLSMIVCRRCAMVSTVQSLNALAMVACGGAPAGAAAGKGMGT